MIRIPLSILKIIREQARKELPNEACGYLCGRSLRENVEAENAGAENVQAENADTVPESGDIAAEDIIRMTNADASPEHFSFEPGEQFAALKKSREKGLALVAVYHSHPETLARMSREDIRLANDTEIIYLIYSLLEDEIKGFKVDERKNVTNYKVEVEND